MSNTNITKSALAEGLHSLLKKKKLSQITIKDITTECSISRNAFYYHFCDKYDLVKWMFLSETLPAINTFSEPDRYFDGFVNLCKQMIDDRQFYTQVFSYEGQNSVQEVLTETYFELIKIHLSTTYAKIGYRLTDDEMYILARMETYAYVGIILEWIKGGMKDNYISYFEKMKKFKSKLAFQLSVPEITENSANYKENRHV